MASALGGKEASRLAQQLTQQGRGPVPWAGVAAPLAEPSAPAHTLAEPAPDPEGPDGQTLVSSSSSSSTAVAAASAGLQGRAFCFLPLPLPTGLPVHVNGLFEYGPSLDPSLATSHAHHCCNTGPWLPTAAWPHALQRWAPSAAALAFPDWCTRTAGQPCPKTMFCRSLCAAIAHVQTCFCCCWLCSVAKLCSQQLNHRDRLPQAQQQQARPVVWGGHGGRWEAALRLEPGSPAGAPTAAAVRPCG